MVRFLLVSFYYSKTNLIQKDIMAAISDSEVDELLELHI